MEFSEKLEICCEEMSKLYGIATDVASEIITDFDLEDKVFEHFAEDIENAEKQQLENWTKEIEDNPDLYIDDIHGGV